MEHMGGSGQIERTLKRIRQEAPGPMRTVVIVDSDRLAPEQETYKTRQLGKFCPTYNATGFILRKREAENYIPLNVLSYAGGSRVNRIFQSFKSLSQKQRDYFDMKKGFPSKGIPEEQKTLYNDLSDYHIEKLKHGFGDKCWELFREHIKLFKEEEIRKICPEDPDEIPRMLDLLEQII